MLHGFSQINGKRTVSDQYGIRSVAILENKSRSGKIQLIVIFWNNGIVFQIPYHQAGWKNTHGIYRQCIARDS